MALEALLPSEIARLVYGYLLTEKCPETAHLFLEECTDLLECKNVLIRGGKFCTRVCGYQLLDILEQFCVVSIFVQDKIVQLEVSDKLKNCNNLITKINVLLENCRDKSEQNNCSASEEEQSSSTQNKQFENRNLCFKKCTQNSNQENFIEEPTSPNSLYELDKYNESCNKTRNAVKYATASSQTSLDVGKKNELFKDNVNIQKTFETNCTKEMMANKFAFGTNIFDTDSRLGSQNEVKSNKGNCIVDSRISDCIKISHLEKEPREQIDNADKTLELNKSQITNNSNESASKFHNDSFKKTQCGVDTSYSSSKNKTIPAVMNKTDPVMFDPITKIIDPNQVASNTDHRAPGEVEKKQIKEVVSSLTEKVIMNSISNLPDPVNKISNTNLENVKMVNMPLNEEKNKLDFRLTVSDENDAIKPEHKLASPVNPQAVFIMNQESVQPAFLDVSKNVETYSGKQVFSQTEVVEKDSNQNKAQFQNGIENTHSIFLVPHEIPISTVTSTPMKIGFDTSEWCSSSSLPTPNLFFQRAGVCSFEETVSNNKLPAASPVILKDQTLHTPDVVCPPKTRIITIKTPEKSTTESSNLHKCPSGLTAINDLIMQTLQKSPVISDSNDASKLFNFDTMMLYGADNSTIVMPKAWVSQEITVEDSISVSNMGLSPFLKIHKLEKNNSNADGKNKQKEGNGKEEIVKEKNLKSANNDESKKIEESLSNVRENTTFKRSNSYEVKELTPQALMPNNITDYNTRLSLSTPRNSSHIRALDFDLPPIRASSERSLKSSEKPPTIDALKRDLPKASYISSLFQSPPVENHEIIEPEFRKVSSLLTETLVSNTPHPAINLSSCNDMHSQCEKSKDIAMTEIPKTDLNCDLKLGENKIYNQNGQEPVNTDDQHPFEQKSKNKEGSNASKRSKNEKRSKKSKKHEKSPKKSSKAKKEKYDKETKSESNKKQNEKKKKHKKESRKEKIDVKDNKNNIKKNDKNEDNAQNKKVKAHGDIKELKKTNEENFMNENEAISAITCPLDSQTRSIKQAEVSKVEIELDKSKNNPHDLSIDKGSLYSKMSIDKSTLNTKEDIAKNTSTTESFKKVETEIIFNEKCQPCDSSLSLLETLLSSPMDDIKYNVDKTSVNISDIKMCENGKKNEEETKPIAVDYDKIEEELSKITHEKCTSHNLSGSSYIIVDKMEQGKLVKKKYARLKTLNTSVTPPEDQSHNPLHDYLLDVTPEKYKLLTPKILSPSSDEEVSLKMDNKNSKSISCFGSITPKECPCTPTVVITPPKIDKKEQNTSKISCADGVPVYKLRPITFDSPPVKREVNQLKVVKENLKPSIAQTTSPNMQSDKKSISTKDFLPINKDDIARMSKKEYQTCSSNESTCSHSSCSCDSDSDSTLLEDETEKKPIVNVSESFKSNASNLRKNQSYEETDLEAKEVFKITNNPETGQGNKIEMKMEEKPESDPKMNFKDAGQMKSLIESSPIKVFSVIKSAEELAEMTNETPAKEDNGVQEEGIFETPFLTKPTENSKYKLHDVMMKTEKTKPKIISIESVIPTIKIQTASNLKAIVPSFKTQVEDSHSLSLKQQQQRIIVEKCEEEINDAIKSIIDDGKVTNEQLEISIQSIKSTPAQLNESMSECKKVELSKAIQSITHYDHASENSDDSEANLRLILDDEDKSAETEKPVRMNLNVNETLENTHNTRSKSKKQDLQFDDCAPNAVEINVKYEDSSIYGKRKRMKHYSDEDLARSIFIEEDDGSYMIELESRKMEIIYEHTPARKISSTAKKPEKSQSQKSPKKRKAANTNTNKNNKKRKKSVYIW